MATDRRNPPTVQDQDAAWAFDVHAALVMAESKSAYLKNNPRWQLLRMDAYEAVQIALRRV